MRDSSPSRHLQYDRLNPTSPRGYEATASLPPIITTGDGAILDPMLESHDDHSLHDTAEFMKSTNFEFIRPTRPELADIAGFAERYVYSDTGSCLVKMRIFCEAVVAYLYRHYRLQKPYRANLVDMIADDQFTAAAPQRVANLLDLLRQLGNPGAHHGEPLQRNAHIALETAFDIAKWLYVHVDGGKIPDVPVYKRPPKTTEEPDSATLDLLSEREKQIEELKAKLKGREEAAKASDEELQRLNTERERGNQSADDLKINEAETRRRLIDAELADVGWDVTDESQVAVEYPVDGQPTDSGKGYADYVLWDENGKPLAVIEAKKTARDPNEGEHQAKLYADALEREFSQYPAIYYTSGYDIRFWNRAAGYPPRRVWGYMSRDSLNYRVQYQRAERQPLEGFSVDKDIAGRIYQIETIKAVCERFANKHRHALIVQATGTGKTRVAIALTKLLMEAGWVRRVLFLCDRKELRKQAFDAFKEFVTEPIFQLSGGSPDAKARILTGTYPGMMQHFRNFDVGYFDLIIADESHRSIYNRYRELFQYFDALQVGLTATPVDFIERNTFRMFGCESEDPTAYYPFEEAVEEKWLVPFEVKTVTTEFLRKGIKYDDLSDEQREQLEEDIDNAEEFEAERSEIDKQVLNKGTARSIMRNLMENGIREATGQHVGKSIVFARSHKHAVLLKEMFDELYPQYGGNFCQVIDNYVERAEDRITEFKKVTSDLTIAISVDMLDTGIDVPQVVNLVFAKPVKSKVKFWQMIGRGTRLCENLFGPGAHKNRFLIFDHWNNFKYFSVEKKQIEGTRQKSLMQQLFEARLQLAEIAHNGQNIQTFDTAVEQLAADAQRLVMTTIAVRERHQVVLEARDAERIRQFEPAMRQRLKQQVAPLMQYANIRGEADAYRFDLTMTQAMVAKATGSGEFEDHRDRAINTIARLPISNNAVRQKADWLEKGKDTAWWLSASLTELEQLRANLRGVMRYQQRAGGGDPEPPVTIDVSDDDIESATYTQLADPVRMRLYEEKLTKVLQEIVDTDPTLRKIRRGEPVTEEEMEQLASQVLIQRQGIDLEILRQFYGSTVPLAAALRRIIGMEPDAVRKKFEAFVQKFPQLTAKQLRFMRLLQNHLVKFGTIKIDSLYEQPFTQIDAMGIDGVFEEKDAGMLVEILRDFQPPKPIAE